MNTYPDIPASLRNLTFLQDGTLHASEALRGDMVLESYVSLLRRHGVTALNWHSADTFDALRSSHHLVEQAAANDIQAQAMRLLHTAFEADASDIHISYQATYGSIRLRRMGMLDPGRTVSGESAIILIRTIYQAMTDAGDPQFIPSQRQEGRIVKREYLPPFVHSVRVHTEPLECQGGPGLLMTLRLLYDRTRADGSLDQRLTTLGYMEDDRMRLAKLIRRNGLTLVAGPTGQGKSTLLKHVIEAQAAQEPELAFMSIEDPPEYPIRGVSQVLVGSDEARRERAYQQAIAGAMRADPDVLMIGEVRYPEAAAAAVEAALTGHTVWSSIHASSAFGVLWRMLSLLNSAKFADPLEYLCDPGVLAGMIYQRLLPVLCPACKVSLTALTKSDHAVRAKWLSSARPTMQRLRRTGIPLDNVHFRGSGCQQCKGVGLCGLTVVPEVVVTDAAMLRLVRKRDMDGAMQYWRHELQGTTAVQRALALIADGQVDPVIAEERLSVELDQEERQTADTTGGAHETVTKTGQNLPAQ
jgi:type II secretory ATPase GspE/PulE/Tfp pilus assembly ATPase PilB-like protein